MVRKDFHFARSGKFVVQPPYNLSTFCPSPQFERYHRARFNRLSQTNWAAAQLQKLADSILAQHLGA